MDIQKILILIVKVILLLSVILIFSYVNTKKAHIEKVEKIKKKNIKEGNNPNKKILTMDNVVDNIVEKTKKMLLFQSKQDDADVDMLSYALDAIEDREVEEQQKELQKEHQKELQNESPSNTIEGFETEEDKERDKMMEEKKKKKMKKLQKMQKQRCKYKGKTLFTWIYWFFYTILYGFVWLAKAMYDLLDEKTKEKPKSFISTIFAPFSFIFYGIKKFAQFVLWIFLKMKYVITFIISTIGNILFVFAPDFVVEILAYFFSPLIVFWRSITSLPIFSPLGAFCWDS